MKNNEVAWSDYLKALRKGDRLKFAAFVTVLESFLKKEGVPVVVLAVGSVLNPKGRPYEDIDLVLYPQVKEQGREFGNRIIPRFAESQKDHLMESK